MTRADFDKAIGLVFSGSQAHQVCNEYIKSLEAELEALQQHKSCETCAHRSLLDEVLTNKVTNGFCVENGFFTKHGFCCNRYEQKEQQ